MELVGTGRVNKQKSILKKARNIILVLSAAAFVVIITGCGYVDSLTLRATPEDCIGIWARYKTNYDSDKPTEHYDIDNDEIRYNVLFKDGTGVLIAYKRGATDYLAIDCTWRKAKRKEVEAYTNDGIVITADGDSYLYEYYSTGDDHMEPNFIDERLVEGNLAVEYYGGGVPGYEDSTDYYEKISDYPYDKSWLPMADSL